MAPTIDELQQELDFRSWANDPVKFFHDCWWITHPVHGKVLFNLRPEQQETLGAYMTFKTVVVLKARQIGWSTLTTAYAFWSAFFHPDRKIIFISRREKEAQDLLNMVKYGYDRLPEWVRARGPRPTRDNLTRMPFDNGSTIVSDSVASDPARGQTAWLVVMDEAASIPSPEDAWASIEPTTDIGGRAIILSTAKGSGDWFHSMWIKANDSRTRFHPLFYPWSVVPERDDAWYEAKAFEMEPWQLHQEYPTTPEEAFLRSGNAFFDIDLLRGMRTTTPVIGDVEGPYDFKEKPNGKLRVFEFPQAERRSNYVIGADVAEGLPGGDYTSVHVINARTGKVAAHWHGHIEADEFGDLLHDLGYYYGTALVGVENAQHGASTLHRLRQLRYPNIYVQRTQGMRFDKQQEKLGWSTNKATKPRMMDELARALRYPDEGITLTCVETIKELMGYVRDTEDGKLHGSPHDDRVVSLAIANQMLEFAYDPKYVPKVNNEWTVGWWAEQIVRPKADDGEFYIGANAVHKGTPV